MKCPRCAQDNPLQAKFCLECGAPMNGAMPGPSSSAEVQAEIESLKRSLREALERETAASEILGVISRSPTNVQPVFDTIASNAVRVCDSTDAVVALVDGRESVIVAHCGDQGAPTVGQRRPIIAGLVLGRALLEGRPVQVEDLTSTDEFPQGRDLALRMGHRTVMAVPLLRDGVAIGGILMRRSAVKAFTDKQIALLQTFAAQAVIAIENVRLFKELQEKNRALTEAHAQVTEALEQQTATSDILRIIASSPTEIQPVLDSVTVSAARLSNAEDAAIFLIDNGVLRLVAHHGPIPSGTVGEFTLPLTRGTVGGRTVLDRELVHVQDLQAADADFPEGAAYARALGQRAQLGVPLLREGAAIGVLGVRRAAPVAYTENQIALLRTFADQVVIAIENVRLFKELQSRNRDLTEALDRQTATAEILSVISRSPTDLQPVLNTVAESASRLCRAANVSLFRVDGDSMRKVAEYESGPQLTTLRVGETRRITRGSVSGRAIVDRMTIQLDDQQAPEVANEFPDGARRDTGIRSTVGIPLIREGSAIGAFTVYRTDYRPFSDAEIALLQTFADQAVIAIENVRLFGELETKNAHLAEALNRETATAEILKVISGSPNDVQPVLDAVAESTARLCAANDVLIHRVEDGMMRLVAHFGSVPYLAESATRVISLGAHSGRAILESRVIHDHDLLDPRSQADYPDVVNLGRLSGTRTVLAMPLLREGTPIGVIVIRRREVRPFSDEQIDLVKTFADQAVIAIENVRLFKELEARNRDLTAALDQQTATSEILGVISRSPTDVQPVFDAIVRSAARLCDGVFCNLFRLDGALVHLVAGQNLSPEALRLARQIFPAPLTRELTAGRAILDRAVTHIPDIEKDPELNPSFARAMGARSALTVPMFRDGQPIGTINVGRAEPGPFSSKQIELMQTFADQAVIAIENVRLFKELEARTAALTRSVDQLTALGEVGRAVSSTLDLETVLTTIVSRAAELTGTDGGAIYEYDDAAEQFWLRAEHGLAAGLVAAGRQAGIHKGEGALGRLAVTREPIQITDIADEGAYQSHLRELLLAAGVRSLLAVPLLSEDRLIGGLVVNRNQPGDFASEVVDLLRTFATQSALAIRNARLFREIEVKSRELAAASQHKSEFLANMSHELRTPLNAVIGFSEVLRERMFGDLNEKQDEYLKDIHASGQHLLSLINDILDLSKVEAGRMELELSDFDLPATLDNALTLVRERAGRHGITLQINVDERVGQVGADERKIRQVLLNLLSNAIKFTPEGGRIDVNAKPVDGHIEVSVSDTGVGIAPEDQEAIFEEFQQVGTAAKKVEGTGLGLALARKFIELHGGKIWVKSESGAGSTFTFTTPVRHGE